MKTIFFNSWCTR